MTDFTHGTVVRGGFNWYRNIYRLPGCLAPFVGRTIEQPSFYIGGTLDLIANNTPEAIEGMRAALPDLRGLYLVEDAGHWIQQERPEFCNEKLLGFLATLDRAPSECGPDGAGRSSAPPGRDRRESA
jgi:pimeloyl-ACP methyl ester carboxylesterase